MLTMEEKTSFFKILNFFKINYPHNINFYPVTVILRIIKRIIIDVMKGYFYAPFPEIWDTLVTILLMMGEAFQVYVDSMLNRF